MKKFKLIKTYPGSPKVGTVLAPKVDKENPSTNNYYWEGSWFNPNDFCEFWEEVFEQNYEIVARKIRSGAIVEYEKGIAVRRSDGLGVEGTVSLEFALQNIYCSRGTSLHSVKRLSDGEVFTVGDCFDAGLGSRTITSIWVDKEGVLGFNHEHGRISNTKGTGVFHKAKKLQPALFTTEDGVEIRKGDKIYIITEIVKDQIMGLILDEWRPYEGAKSFSTKEAAQKYVDSQKVLFTTEDGVEIRKGDRYYFVDVNSSSVSFETAHVWSGGYLERKYFSTYEKAERYLMRHKPCLSLDDVLRYTKIDVSDIIILRNLVKQKAC